LLLLVADRVDASLPQPEKFVSPLLESLFVHGLII
jgi:hypothetical protein